MTTITLPPAIQSIVDTATREDHFATPTEYLTDLVLRDRMYKSDEALEAFALEGINSGEATEMTPESWRKLRLELHRQAGIA